jgi:hypothetical protein
MENQGKMKRGTLIPSFYNEGSKRIRRKPQQPGVFAEVVGRIGTSNMKAGGRATDSIMDSRPNRARDVSPAS